MRSASNFHPEWGYLAPAPSFMRTARIVLVATAIGATAGAAVVLSLVDRPAAENGKAFVAARAIVTSVEAAPATSAPISGAAVAAPVVPANVVTAVPKAAPPVQAIPPAAPQTASEPPPVTAAQPAAAALPQPPAQPAPGVASLADVPAAAETGQPDGHEEAILPPENVPPENVPPDKKPKHHVANSYAPAAAPPGLGTVLRRLFNAPTSAPNTSRSYYPGYYPVR